MLGTFLGLETSKRSLLTQTAALDTTAHNISNADTPGYSKEVVDMTPSSPLAVPGLSFGGEGQMGTGVQVEEITRVRDQFLDDQYRNQNQYLGYWNVTSDTVTKISGVINEPSNSGLSSVMSQFWNDWDKLASDPASAQSLVVQDGLTVTQTLNQTAKQLGDLQTDLTTNLKAQMDQANSYISQLAGINKQIDAVQTAGDIPNDLLDQRDQIVDQLSNLANVSIQKQDANGKPTFQLSIGSTLVLDNETVVTDPNDSTKPILNYNTDTTNPNAPLSFKVTGGEIGGYINSLKTVTTYQAQLDSFANGLATGQMNITLQGDWTDNSTTPPTQYHAGDTVTIGGPNGVGGPNHSGGLNGLTEMGNPSVDFFTTSDGTATISASNITVNPALQADATQLPAGFSAAAGDGTLASTVSNIKNTNIDFTTTTNEPLPLTSGTLDGYLQSLVGNLGVQGQQANTEATNQQKLVQQLNQQRQSVAGVSIDEEMTNMVKFQQSYNASAKMMQAVNEMLQTLISSVN